MVHRAETLTICAHPCIPSLHRLNQKKKKCGRGSSTKPKVGLTSARYRPVRRGQAVGIARLLATDSAGTPAYTHSKYDTIQRMDPLPLPLPSLCINGLHRLLCPPALDWLPILPWREEEEEGGVKSSLPRHRVTLSISPHFLSLLHGKKYYPNKMYVCNPQVGRENKTGIHPKQHTGLLRPVWTVGPFKCAVCVSEKEKKKRQRLKRPLE